MHHLNLRRKAKPRGIYSVSGLIKRKQIPVCLAIGFLRGIKTTFTPSAVFVKMVRKFVYQPWDLIVILFQLGASTAIVYGIISVVSKSVRDINTRIFLPNQKVQKSISKENNEHKKGGFDNKSKSS